VKERNSVVVVLLMLLTCGLYGFYWLYATTDELQKATGRSDLNPMVDLLLAIVTFGLWGLYAQYRNARIVHEEMTQRALAHSDQSNMILLFNVLTLATGLTCLIGVVLTQEEYNRLARELPAAPLATTGPLPVTF
jgi:hypothetical protein